MVGSLIFYFLIKCYLYVSQVTMLQWRTRDANCTFGISTLTHGHTWYPGLHETRPCRAGQNVSSNRRPPRIQSTDGSPQSRYYTTTFLLKEDCGGPPTTTALSSFLHLTMAVLILLSPKVEAFPLTQAKIRQVLLIKQPPGDGEGIRPDPGLKDQV